MKILLLTDGSEYTKRMLAYVAAHNEWLGDRHQYTVLHVVPFVPPRASSMLPRGVIQGAVSSPKCNTHLSELKLRVDELA